MLWSRPKWFNYCKNKSNLLDLINLLIFQALRKNIFWNGDVVNKIIMKNWKEAAILEQKILDIPFLGTLYHCWPFPPLWDASSIGSENRPDISPDKSTWRTPWSQRPSEMLKAFGHWFVSKFTKIKANVWILRQLNFSFKLLRRNSHELKEEYFLLNFIFMPNYNDADIVNVFSWIWIS